MMLATIWGLSHGIAVAPIDWWDDTQNAREVRDKLGKQPEYTEKGNEEKAIDLLGQRKEALDCYARSEQLIIGTRWERVKSYVLQNYKEVPYRRPKRK